MIWYMTDRIEYSWYSSLFGYMYIVDFFLGDYLVVNNPSTWVTKPELENQPYPLVTWLVAVWWFQTIWKEMAGSSRLTNVCFFGVETTSHLGIWKKENTGTFAGNKFWIKMDKLRKIMNFILSCGYWCWIPLKKNFCEAMTLHDAICHICSLTSTSWFTTPLCNQLGPGR